MSYWPTCFKLSKFNKNSRFWKETQRYSDRISYYRYKDYIKRRHISPKTYRWRWFQRGDIQGNTAGTWKSWKYTSWTVLQIWNNSRKRLYRKNIIRYSENAWEFWTAWTKGQYYCNSRQMSCRNNVWL